MDIHWILGAQVDSIRHIGPKQADPHSRAFEATKMITECFLGCSAALCLRKVLRPTGVNRALVSNPRLTSPDSTHIQINILSSRSVGGT